MSDTANISIIDGNLHLKNISIINKEIVNYFQNLPKLEDKEKKLSDLLEIGIIATKSINLTENTQYVDKAFEKLSDQFTQHLTDAFGEDGDFSNVLETQFGTDGVLMKKLLDPTIPDTPLYKLNQDLAAQISKLRDDVITQKATATAREKSTLKGLDFEKEFQKRLEELAAEHSDILEITKNKPGTIKDSKKGDFVLTLNNTTQKIVFEVKHIANITQRNILDELTAAMENRNSDYGIFIAKNKTSLPSAFGWFNEYNETNLVCAMGDDNESLFDGEMLKIAYKWAKTRLQLKDAKINKFSVKDIESKLKSIRDKVKEFNQIKTECKNITKSTTAINDTSSAIQNKINEQLDEISNLLQNSNGNLNP